MLETRTMSRPTATMERVNPARPTVTMGEQEPLVSRTHVSLGTVIKGYVLTGVIAENTGEASLFLCEKGGANYVAKIYHRDKKPKPEILVALKAIASPYVISVIEDGEIEGRYFEILLYYQDGDVAKSAPLSADYLLTTFVPNVAEALFALHNKGIVHRDIKPTNIFFGRGKNHVVLGDFGISSLLTSGMTVRLTSASRTIGYGAPEATQGFVSSESDYYSLGITLLYLATGADPFAGMTDTQILMQTLNYKLEIPQSLPPRLANLIRGLTVKERTDRWGYDEIRKWLNNESVEIRESDRQRSDLKPYILVEGQELFGLEELSLSLAEHWQEGIKHLYRGFVKEYLKHFRQDLASKAVDLEEERDQDLGLFKLIYTMNPNAPLCWRGEMFVDLESFGAAIKKILPTKNASYFELLRCGALQYFVKTKKYRQELVDEVKSLEALAIADGDTAYYRLGYLMSGSDEFSFNGVVLTSVDDLAGYIHAHRTNIVEISEKLLNSKYFFAWLEHLGFQDTIDNWKRLPNF